MKSHVSGLYQVVSGILADFQAAYPTIKGVDRDKARLSLLIKDRGLGVFTLDLPSRAEKIIRSLETGCLDVSGVLLHSKRYRVPRLFSGLYMQLYDEQSCLKPCFDENVLMFLIQLLVIGKKTEIPCSRKREVAAVQEYIQVEESLYKPTLSWGADVLDHPETKSTWSLGDIIPLAPDLFEGNSNERRRQHGLLERCQKVADILSNALGLFNGLDYSRDRSERAERLGFRHGPGAVAERTGKFDKNNFVHWSAKLQRLFPYEDFGTMPNDPKGRPPKQEAASRLIAVPKTVKGPRLIAAEPTEHQWIQQLMLAWFEERFDSIFDGSFISLRDQAASGAMVVEASLTKRLATVDLSSASDRLTCYVVERIFRRNPSVLASLHACRTRFLRIGLLREGGLYELKKYASQGTATTFPVQSFVFLCCALASSIRGHVTWAKIARLRSQVRVFGDDIILPSHGYADLVELLHLLQLKVNVNKSFVNGYFRESCGVDAYKGLNITPLKPKTTIPDGPASRKAVLDTYNNLFMKGYWNASERLVSTNGGSFLKRIAVMGRDAGATGRVSFSFDGEIARRYDSRTLYRTWASAQGGGRRTQGPQTNRMGEDNIFNRSGIAAVLGLGARALRFNRRLQRIEVRSYSIWSRSPLEPRDCGYSALLQFSIAEPPSGPFGLPRLSGVAERSHTRDGMRWEPLETYVSKGVR